MRDVRKFGLVKPDEAKGRTREIYDEIIRYWGKSRLVPVFGFWARDPEVLESVWLPLRKFEHEETKTSKEILVGACVIGALRVGCARCINFHVMDLTERLGVTSERVELISDYEKGFREGGLTEAEYVAFAYVDCLSQGTPFPEDKWEQLSRHYSDSQIYEMAVITLIESCFARYGMVMAGYDQSAEWPDEYRPSGAYSAVMGGEESSAIPAGNS